MVQEKEERISGMESLSRKEEMRPEISGRTSLRHSGLLRGKKAKFMGTNAESW